MASGYDEAYAAAASRNLSADEHKNVIGGQRRLITSVLGAASKADWDRCGGPGQANRPFGLALDGLAAWHAHGGRGGSRVIDLATDLDPSATADGGQLLALVENALTDGNYRFLRWEYELKRLLPRTIGLQHTLYQWAVEVDGEWSILSLSSSPRSKEPVLTSERWGFGPATASFGPVRHPDDVAAGLMRKWVVRGLPEDYRDVAHLLEGKTQQQWTAHDLVRLAQRLDPQLKPQQFEDAAEKFDNFHDGYFPDLHWREISDMRTLFGGFARDLRDSSRVAAAREHHLEAPAQHTESARDFLARLFRPARNPENPRPASEKPATHDRQRSPVPGAPGIGARAQRDGARAQRD